MFVLMRINVAKTKVLRCCKKCGQVEESGKFPCGVCKTGVGSNAVLCGMCGKWVHQKCSGMKGKLRNNVGSSVVHVLLPDRIRWAKSRR